MAKIFVTWALLEPAQTHKAVISIQTRQGSGLTATEAGSIAASSFPGCTLYETREYTAQQVLNHVAQMISQRTIPLIRVSTGALNDVSIDLWKDALNAKFGLAMELRI